MQIHQTKVKHELKALKMNKESFSLFHESLNKISNLEYSALTLSKDQKLATLFIPFCDKKNISNFLRAILKKIPATKDSINTRWSIIQMIKALGENCNNNISDEMAMIDFSNMKDQTSKNIMPYISVHKQINDKIAHNLSFFMLLLRDEKPGIFYSVLDSFQQLVFTIGHERLFKAVGFEFLSFCIAPPIDFIECMQEFDPEQMISIFHYNICYEATEFSHYLQSKFTTDYQFPTPFPVHFNPHEISLLNCSFEHKKHYVDLVTSIVSDAIISADIETINKSTCLFPELFPYILIVLQPMMYSDLESYSELLETHYIPSPATTVIESFRNDFHLLQLMSMLTGGSFCSGDLITNSIPYHLLSVLDKQDEILKASSYKYFSLTEEDSNLDFDFIRSFSAIRIFLSIWTKPPQKLNDAIDQICNYIKTTQNVIQKSMLVIDLFSLIFTMDEKGSYICKPYVAYKMIQMLVQFGVSPYIEGADALFQKHKPGKSEQSLSPWFDKDPSNIYSAIEKKKWEEADKLTTYIPFYRKIFTRSHMAHLYVEEGTEPKQIIIKLDVSLSSFGATETLKQLKSQFHQFSPIIDERIKNPNDTIIAPVSDFEKWNPVNEFVSMLDLEPLEMIKDIPIYEGTTKISPSLNRFLTLLELYYNCAKFSDNSAIGSIEDLFTLDIISVFSGPIKVGEYHNVEKLAEFINIDLVPFILQNVDHFEFDPSFFTKIEKEYPIEAQALLYYLNSKSKLKQNYFESGSEHIKNARTIINYFEKLDEKVEETTIPQLSAINNDNLDDLIYKFDHKELYQQLVSLGEEEIVEKYYFIYEIISYVVLDDQKEQERYKKITLLHILREKTSSSDPNEVIKAIMSDGDFELAISYLKNCVSPKSISSPLCQLFSLSCSNKKYIERILFEFPERHDLILSRFFHIPGILATLSEFITEKKEYIKGLSELPEIIFSESNIFETGTIVSSFIRNYKAIFEITEKNVILFNDDQLFDIVKGVNAQIPNEAKVFNHICNHLYNFFTDKSIIENYWISIIEKNLQCFNIDSIENEDKLIAFLKDFHSTKNLLSISSTCNFEKIKILKAASILTSYFPFTRLRISYNFKDFGTESFKDKLFQICKKLDDDSITESIRDLLDIDMTRYYLQQTKNQLIFGQFNDAAQIFQKHTLKIDTYSNVRYYDTTFSYLTPLNKYLFYNQNELKDLSIDKLQTGDFTPVNVYKHICKTSLTSTSMNNLSNPQEVTKKNLLMFSLIQNYATKKAAISMLVSFRQFELAFKILMSTKNSNEKLDLFIHSFYFSVLFNNIVTPFNKFLDQADPNLDLTSNLWEGIIKFFTEKSMPYGLFQVYSIRNQLEDAALIGMKNFKKCESFDTQISLLGQVIYCLDRSLKWRENPHSCSPPFIKSNSSLDNLLHCREISELQLQICSLCIQQGTPFSHDFDIISSHKSAINVAAIFYINREDFMLKQVMKLTDISIHSISTKVCEYLSKEPLPRIMEFWKNMNNHKELLGNDLSYNLLKALSLSSNRQFISPIIISCFHSQEELKCKLLLEYDFLPEAFSIAKSLKLTDLYPLIAHRASVLGQKAIFDNCSQSLA